MPKVKKKAIAFDSLTHKEVCAAFHVGDRAVYKWVEAGCPKNKNGTYSLYDIHEWLLAQVDKGSNTDALETEKLRQQIEKLKLENEKTKGETIPRRDHEAILCSRAASLRNFLERGLSQNRTVRAMRSVEELVSLDYDLVKQMMDTYVGTK
jgi:hypothetical protein